jgi:hypothetical protein
MFGAQRHHAWHAVPTNLDENDSFASGTARDDDAQTPEDAVRKQPTYLHDEEGVRHSRSSFR